MKKKTSAPKDVKAQTKIKGDYTPGKKPERATLKVRSGLKGGRDSGENHNRTALAPVDDHRNHLEARRDREPPLSRRPWRFAAIDFGAERLQWSAHRTSLEVLSASRIERQPR